MIEIKNLESSYGNKLVLKNISLKLEAGKIYGLLGENGVGKTTLLSLLAGLKKPRQGTIVSYDESGEVSIPHHREPSYLAEICYLPDEVYPAPSKARKWAAARGAFWPHFDAALFDRLMKDLEVDPESKMNTMSAGQLKKTYNSAVIIFFAVYGYCLFVNI